MEKEEPVIIRTGDKSHTLYLPSLNESYHSRYGAIRESSHVFIQNGYLQTTQTPLYIFEAGFGTGLNALLTHIASRRDKRTVYYSAIDLHPLDISVVNHLNYTSMLQTDEEIFRRLHNQPWDKEYLLDEKFYLKKIHADLITYHFTRHFDLVYFDAFGPAVQPEMWQETIMKRIFKALNPGGIFVTYSAKGSLRRSLSGIGFHVNRLPGPPGKREMIRAIKTR